MTCPARVNAFACLRIHLVLLVDTLLDDYTRSWEPSFALAFDDFRAKLGQAKKTRHDATPNEYWLRYGVGTRVINSDRAEVIQRRHEFFAEKMHDILKPQMKDPQRAQAWRRRVLMRVAGHLKTSSVLLSALTSPQHPDAVSGEPVGDAVEDDPRGRYSSRRFAPGRLIRETDLERSHAPGRSRLTPNGGQYFA